MLQTSSPSVHWLDSCTYIFSVTVQITKSGSKSAKARLKMQLWNELAEEMRQIQLEHLWETMRTITLFHHKQDDIHNFTIPPHLKRSL